METKNIIFDGEFYYIFHAYEKGDYEDKTGQIRAYSSRMFEKTGKYGKYKPSDEPTLKEVHEHIRMRFEPDTNCISFTKNATVAITYNAYDKYVIAKVPKEAFESGTVFDASDFFLEKIEERIQEILGEGDYIEYQNELTKIDLAENISELEFLLTKYGIDKRSVVDPRQYLTTEEHLRHSRIQAKIKLLDYINEQREEPRKSLIIPEVLDNSRIFRTLGNAYTSEEVIYYGDVPEEQTFECSSEFIQMFSLLEQAKLKCQELERIENMILSLARLVINGYKIEDGKLTNGEVSFELGLTEEEQAYLAEPYAYRENIEKNVSIEDVYTLTGGEISYRDAKLGIIGTSMMSEAILRKRVFQKILKSVFPETNVEDYLRDTYCVSSDIAIKQNGRGHQLTNTVNLIINQYGYDLSPENVSSILLRLDELPSESLFELRNPDKELEKYKTFLSKQMNTNARIASGDNGISRLEYSAEAIIEEYNWLKKRPLRSKDDRIALKEKLLKGIEKEDAFDDLMTLLTEREYNKQQVYAIIMNFAINGKIGNISYTSFMNSTKDEMEEILEQNVQSLELSVEPCNIDILLGRGKKLEELKSRVISYGVSQALIDSVLDKNIYFADKIVTQCQFDRQLTDSEKGAIITRLLDIAPLKKDKGYLLDNVFAEMSARLNLTDQEIYSAIINCAVRNNYIDENGFAYGELTGRYRQQIKELIGRESDINTKVDEFSITAATGMLSDSVKKELTRYGIDLEFIDNKENRNVLTAKQIVEEYKFSRELSDIEKGKIIFALLNNNQLNKGQVGSLRNLYLAMEKELNLSKQEIYGAIINMGVRGNAYSKDSLHNYSTMIHQPKIEVKGFVGNEEYLNTYVDESTVLTATGILSEDIVSKLEEMFDVEEILKEISPQNLRVVYEIVENYKFPDDITRN